MRLVEIFYKFLVVFLFALFLVKGITVFAQAPTNTPTPTPFEESQEDDEEDEDSDSVKGESESNVCSSVPECADKNYSCGKCIEYLNEKKEEATAKADTLASEISAVDSQISLTEARINAAKQQVRQLEESIEIAKNKISDLEIDIDATSKLLIERIAAVYRVGKIAPWEVFLTSNNIADVFNRLKYLRLVQIYDQKRVYAAEQARNDYDNQKNIFEDKEAEAAALSVKLADYNEQLAGEKAGKQELLSVTRNDESRYQRLLAQARAERAIILGGGKDVFLRNVSEGDSIGSVITGASGCSTGTHLHFTITKGGSIRNPSEYLSSKSFSYSYGEHLYGYYGTIDPRGSYSWPLSDPIRITQAYGSHTFAAQQYPGGMHDGIDMTGGGLTVKAVRGGKLYEGSYGGCSYGPLYYAKIEHDDGLETWYLHIYPN